MGNGVWLYEVKRLRFGRGFDSRHLHHYGDVRLRRDEEATWTAGEATDLIGANLNCQ